MTALLTAYLAAVAIGAPVRLQTPVSPPFVVVLNTGDSIYDASSTTPIYTATANFVTRQLLATQYVKTAPPATGSSTVPVSDPTMIVFGDGHALTLEPNTKVQALAPVVVGTNLNGTAVYLSYGQVTIINVSPNFLGGLGASPGPTQVIVKTKATTTGAKGTTVSISATIDSSNNYTTTVVNYDSTQCLLFQGDNPTVRSMAVTLSVGSQSQVTYPNAVPAPMPIPIPLPPSDRLRKRG